jgi:YidC/Oxa1 family membrane protein insertase
VSYIISGLTYLLNLLFQFASWIHLPYWGVAIILLTVVIKMVLYPLQLKQMRSMRRMMDMQPRIKEMQARYKDQPQKAQQEMMALYKKESINPAAGCLPLLVQLPIFWALYRTFLVFNYGDGSSASFIWFSLADPHDPYYILPVLAAATTFLQTKLSSPTASTDPTQKVMLYGMPLMFAWITATVPPGLGLYWVVMNVVTIFQMMIINKILTKEKERAVKT